ncbi:MAG TPA: 3'-5' exonuclease [Oceanipulchritudo sp.]|nr:3'-5' exonuclease [Oceanipulchritudo sp.]
MDRIQRYLDVNRYQLAQSANWENFRFACIDTESTGLDAKRDKLISLAGVAVSQGDICLWDEFSVVLPVAYNTSSVTVHGITRESAADGVEEPEAISRFVQWLGDAIIVGHHIQHDLSMLNLACQHHFGFSMRNVAVDTLEAFLSIKRAGGFPALEIPHRPSLDALCDLFKIVPHDRHTASGDAFLTAQITLRILKEARKTGLWNLSDLLCWYADQPFPHGMG